MYQIQPDLTKDFILSNVSQEEIFEYYLNTTVKIGDLFCSPLRNDKHPTCNFSWYNGTLYFRDWSEPKPKDCFQIVQYLHNCDFYGALRVIKSDLIDYKTTVNIPNKKIKLDSKVKSKSSKKDIKVKIRTFTTQNIDYLSQYGITSQQVSKFNVFSIERLWLNNKNIWTYTDKDPALGYYFGKTELGDQRWKIYFYKREDYRFIGNTNRINGWIQLPKTSDIVIITKSLKDVMTFDRLGVPAIAMQNETTIPYDYIIEELKNRFDNLYSFYDFDYTGVVNANKLKRLYNIPPIFITNGKFNTKTYPNDPKDISDFVKETSILEARQFLENRNINIKTKNTG